MSGHIPVLLDEAVATLAPRDGGVYLDATFGGGGYARAILDRAACTLYAIDRDPDAIARGAALAARYPGRLHVIESRFGDLLEVLNAAGVCGLDGAVFDLGVSSFQLDQAERGFSFRNDGPLDMRMGRAGPSAADLVNTLPEGELADLLYEFGEERASRKIARAIAARRREAPFATTADLASVIRANVRADASGIDPATRSFQALRIAVNEELAEIERGLAQAASMLAPGGRLVVVAFHSLEDRIVKHFMREAAGRGPAPSRHAPGGHAAPVSAPFRLLPGSPVVPGEAEARQNPRARSARLRAMERRPAA